MSDQGASYLPGKGCPPEGKPVAPPATAAMPASVGMVERTLAAVVIRCGCGTPDNHNGKHGPAGPCPRPKKVEDLGVVSYWHRAWYRRWWWHLSSFVKEQLRRYKHG